MAMVSLDLVLEKRARQANLKIDFISQLEEEPNALIQPELGCASMIGPHKRGCGQEAFLVDADARFRGGPIWKRGLVC